MSEIFQLMSDLRNGVVSFDAVIAEVASQGIDPESFASLLAVWMKAGNDGNVGREDVNDEDAAAVARRQPFHDVPKDWPHGEGGDTHTTSNGRRECGSCEGAAHDRALCCQSPRKESHTGELELVDWRYYNTDPEAFDPGLEGRFSVMLEEEADLIAKFSSYKWSYPKIYEEWSSAFRWTCCGMPGDTVFGCDHHGGRGRCSCDYCIGGHHWGGKRCPCDYCEGEVGYSPPATIHNRFLRFPGVHNYTEWQSARGVPWMPSLHTLFPRAFRRQVETLLLCHRNCDLKVNLLGRIPRVLIDEIVIYWADWESLEDAQQDEDDDDDDGDEDDEDDDDDDDEEEDDDDDDDDEEDDDDDEEIDSLSVE